MKTLVLEGESLKKFEKITKGKKCPKCTKIAKEGDEIYKSLNK